MNKKWLYVLGAVGFIYLLTRKSTLKAISGADDLNEDFEEMQEFMIPSYATKYLISGDDKGLTKEEKNAMISFKRYVAANFGSTDFKVTEKKIKYGLSDVAGVPSKGYVDTVMIKFTNDGES